MGDLNGGSGEQTTLFNHRDEQQLLFSTDQTNLLSILGAGMLVPAAVQFRYSKDSREVFGGLVSLWKGGVPDWNSELSDSRSERTVVLEFERSRLVAFEEKGLLIDHPDCLVFGCPLPLSAVKAIYMTSQIHIDDFLRRLMDDVVAEENMFGVLDDLKKIQPPTDLELDAGSVMPGLVEFVDRIGGTLKCLAMLKPTESSCTDYAEQLLSIFIADFGFEDLEIASDSASSITDVDRNMVLALLDVLGEMHPEEGLDQEAILVALEEKLQFLEGVSREEFSRWLSFSSKVLRAEVDVPALSDEGDVVKRGVLLFLLRPDVDRLRNSVDSSICPGEGVLAVATFLCGYFTGLLRLGSEHKGSYSAFVEFVEKLLIAFSGKYHVEKAIESELRSGCAVSSVLSMNGVSLWSRRITKNETLAKVMSRAKTVGYELNYDYKKHRLSYDFQLPRGRSQKVYIELLPPLPYGTEVISFSSPCQDLRKYKKRTPTGPKAIDYLKRNGQRDIYAAFAVSESLEAVVVVATRTVGSLLDVELEFLLEHVATLADEYERDVLKKDNY